jgi:tRNA 2-thiouridine synthesizing protein A
MALFKRKVSSASGAGSAMRKEGTTMVEVDVRGLSCPIPVVKTSKVIKEHPNEELTVLVGTTVSKENIIRLARGKGYSVKVGVEQGECCLQLIPPGK